MAYNEGTRRYHSGDASGSGGSSSRGQRDIRAIRQENTRFQPMAPEQARPIAQQVEAHVPQWLQAGYPDNQQTRDQILSNNFTEEQARQYRQEQARHQHLQPAFNPDPQIIHSISSSIQDFWDASAGPEHLDPYLARLDHSYHHRVQSQEGVNDQMQAGYQETEPRQYESSGSHHQHDVPSDSAHEALSQSDTGYQVIQIADRYGRPTGVSFRVTLDRQQQAQQDSYQPGIYFTGYNTFTNNNIEVYIPSEHINSIMEKRYIQQKLLESLNDFVPNSINNTRHINQFFSRIGMPHQHRTVGSWNVTVIREQPQGQHD